MGKLERIYEKAPIWAQNIMCSVKGYRNHRDRYGKIYYEERKFLEDFDTWSLERKQNYQLQELKKFLSFAKEHSPYYRKLYEGIDLNQITTIDDLKLLPIVDKEMLRANINNVVIDMGEKMGEGHTGGTTGKSLVVSNPISDGMRRMAMLDHFKSRVGFEHLKMRRATFNGKHIIPAGQTKKNFWRYNAACKQMIFSTFHLTEDNMGYYVKELNRFKPHALDGFFTSMCDIARYIERHNIPLTFTPVAIFPTSETLTDTGRELLERVFHCKVYDQYASSEGAPFVTECKNQVKHIELSTGVFEQMEGSDEILVTSFTTRGTPLIRYRIGDRMTFAPADEQCSCGNNAPIVTRIEGRRLDFLYNAEGAKINSGNVANLFKNMPNALIRAQLVQERKDMVTALLEVDKVRYTDAYDELLQKEFKDKFGMSTKLVIQHVDSIPRESSGKFRMIVNKCQ